MPRLRHSLPALAFALLLASLAPARAAEGLTTRPSVHDAAQTIQRFEAAVRAAGWKVFGQIDHAAAAGEAGLTLDRRTVILFGNPRAGTPAMQAHPTLALDLPLRVLVWQDGAGAVYLTRSTGQDIATRVFARHGVTKPEAAQAGTERFLAELARQATE